jgi:N-acyl-D-amino-acid deacylase
MGVTTAVSGNCGYSTADFKRFFAKFENGGYPINQLEQAGHGILRRKSGQQDIYAPAGAGQIEKMKKLAADAFSAGACGLSFGLEYAPGTSTEELIELSRTAAEHGRFISIHGRLADQDNFGPLREALELALIPNASLIYSHLVYMYHGEQLKKALEILEEYLQKNAGIRIDSGMYTAFSTIASSPCFDEKIFLNDESELRRLRAATGKFAGQILDRDKYLEMRNSNSRESLIYDPGNSGDIYTAFSFPDVMVSTDCLEYPPGQGHPQGAATYPYFFRVLVKERQQLSMLDAVRRCTLLPAEAAGLKAKGRIAEGKDADLVVLDWERLREYAQFPGIGDPGIPPSGVKHVFVNGALSIKDEKRLPGVVAGFSIKR